MRIVSLARSEEIGRTAGREAARVIRDAMRQKGEVNVVLATGASQFGTLAQLVSDDEEVDWSRVTVFHLDEYIGMPPSHPASFRRYLQERFVEKVKGLRAFHGIRGDVSDPSAECDRLNALIACHPIDVALIGIGENGHLAFNDPPADFEREDPYIIVELDDACRRQQLGEGWFPSLKNVPRKAISMSMRHIMKSKTLIVSVPDLRKAKAVKACLEGPVSPDCPASLLQTHPTCYLYLDRDSASLLSTVG